MVSLLTAFAFKMKKRAQLASICTNSKVRYELIDKPPIKSTPFGDRWTGGRTFFVSFEVCRVAGSRKVIK